jgi:Predicted integral membrane protein (DUF2269)
MLQLFLFLHVMGAIVVFGPVYLFPVISSRARQSPGSMPFVAGLSEFISRRIVLPGAIVQGITGVGLILILGADLTSSSYRWLVGGIVLYLIAVSYAIFVQLPAAAKMVRLLSSGPPPGPPPAGAPGGPPPEVAATARQLQRGGMLLAGLIFLIVALMVVKPSF